jgi:uncharacterized protein YgbK (DUF1537 family)
VAVQIGCIADDFTGASDLAGMLQQAGMRTLQVIGVPSGPVAAAPMPSDPDVDAIVIALKSRTAPVEQAVGDTLAAHRWLQGLGIRQLYFKYCSTFDSTDQGNIGPVIDALLKATGADFTVVCPAFPENQRTVYKGHLFVGDILLAESGMRDHPLTPMTDSNLVRVLQRQTASTVGLIDHGAVGAGANAVRDRMQQLRQQGVRMAVVDAIANADLIHIGAACAGLPLVTGGSGLAMGLSQNFAHAAGLRSSDRPDDTPAPQGLRAIVSGSCSQASQAQLKDLLDKGTPGFGLDPLRLASGDGAVQALVDEAMAWASSRIHDGPVVIYATAPPGSVKQVQQALGVERAGALIEQALATIAQELVEQGVRQLIVAGGETSGAVVTALGIEQLRIGRQIDPGVSWAVSLNDRPVALALKSGNFGSVDLFSKAWETAP